MLFTADRDEKEQEIQVLLEIRKALEKLMEFIEKMQLEEERIYMQLIEREKQRSHVSSVETVTNLKLRKVRSLLGWAEHPWSQSTELSGLPLRGTVKCSRNCYL